ncbi:CHAP domain-containing protein [Streptomyces sp. B3I8]|uniref:CHAP domain-containing protein n=1 Tax=Streptomyces sp. B3I8 TaxID=3042303 RepID=UPI0027847D3D|nr:CHAP domain-containing protein [Streptomyces sp. B3I8]MDQ0785779.1 surface antigen [Streptomyces sp. B3I8]
MQWRTSRKWSCLLVAGVAAALTLGAPGPAEGAASASVTGAGAAGPPGVRPVRGAATAARGLDPSAYPWRGDGRTWEADGHGYYVRSCASFAAWAVRADGRPRRHSPDFLGDARSWRGATTVRAPRAGDIAQWDPGAGGAGRQGHVAYVAATDGARVTLYEYNFRSATNGHRPQALNVRTVPARNPSRYLRF